MYLCSDLGFRSYAGAFDFFILHFPSLYQIHFCICCNFFPQANNASTYGVVRIFSDFVCAPFVLMKSEEQIIRSEDTEDTGFFRYDSNRRLCTPGNAKALF